MKEAFEKIRKELRVKKDNLIHNLQLFKYKGMAGMVSVCESELNAYIDALSIVYEVEAEYGNGWIPCSERLPEIGQRVLLWVYGRVHIGERMGHKLFEKYDVFDLKNGTFESTKRIEAWMPLPEAYKPET